MNDTQRSILKFYRSYFFKHNTCPPMSTVQRELGLGTGVRQDVSKLVEMGHLVKVEEGVYTLPPGSNVEHRERSNELRGVRASMRGLLAVADTLEKEALAAWKTGEGLSPREVYETMRILRTFCSRHGIIHDPVRYPPMEKP